mmetsp:Transcript_5021/g.11477  ORF Transcript_5021/g.11477 Transcript_5021/m.11477 type:complete len:115 (+) Transcript_5021:984-1328(+)
MVIIKADDSRHVGNEGVGFPSSFGAVSTSEGSALFSAEGGGNTTHEGGLSAAGIGGEADDDGGLAFLQCLKGGRRAHATESGGHEGRGGGGREGNEGDGKLHGSRGMSEEDEYD